MCTNEPNDQQINCAPTFFYGGYDNLLKLDKNTLAAWGKKRINCVPKMKNGTIEFNLWRALAAAMIKMSKTCPNNQTILSRIPS